MTSKLKRGDIVQYHTTGTYACLNGAIGVVERVRKALYLQHIYQIVWIAGDLRDGGYGPGVLRKVADGEV